MSFEPHEQFGVHFMLDGYGAPREALNDYSSLVEMLHDIPERLGMHAISKPTVVEVGPKNRKDPGGLSGFILIAESHISVHAFPKLGCVSIDVYSCQDSLDTELLTDLFRTSFHFGNFDIHLQDRGGKYPTRNIY